MGFIRSLKVAESGFNLDGFIEEGREEGGSEVANTASQRGCSHGASSRCEFLFFSLRFIDVVGA